ncbi:hypothetical protein BU17DRAFT_70346 [Hysterangium stoloniferum]|nr:hypothetical protein BU17DRAFT_70346 [Hysterangium stoloniferum]
MNTPFVFKSVSLSENSIKDDIFSWISSPSLAVDTPYSQRFFILSAFCFSQFGRSTAQRELGGWLVHVKYSKKFYCVFRSVHALRDWVEQTPLINDAEGVEEPHEILRVPHCSRWTGLGTNTATKQIDQYSHYFTMHNISNGRHYSRLLRNNDGSGESPDDRGGERDARADWVWEFWEYDWSFRQGNKTVNFGIHNPTGPQYPQHPLAYYVPKDLLGAFILI